MSMRLISWSRSWIVSATVVEEKERVVNRIKHFACCWHTIPPLTLLSCNASSLASPWQFLLLALHMHELEGYLGILPFYGAALYLVALFVQKNARGIFPLWVHQFISHTCFCSFKVISPFIKCSVYIVLSVYGLCALGVFGPVLLLVATGPWNEKYLAVPLYVSSNIMINLRGVNSRIANSYVRID